jgi:hypothetical protein
VFNRWFTLASQATKLGFDAQHVIALRVIRLAIGGAAGHAEAQRMLSEKSAAFLEAQVAAAGALVSGKGAVATKKVLAVYTKRVRANKRRLGSH